MDKITKRKLYITAFILPIIMFTAISALLKMYPFFGDNTFLLSDMSNQFISFYAYFKNIILTDNNLIYTFSKNLGGDMVGFSAYYLQNPFLFLLLLFPEKYLTVGILVMLLLQSSAMSLAMMIFLADELDNSDEGMISGSVKIGLLIASVSYAFMGYRTAYITLPIYTCSLIMFPLVMLGIKKLVCTGKRLLYILSLALCIFFNYYIGYMTCIFAVLFFAFIFLIKSEKGSRLKCFIDFAVSSILAGGLTAFDVIPVVKSLSGQKDAPSAAALSVYKLFSIKSFVRNLLPRAYLGDVSNAAAPYVYVGIVILIFVIVYYVVKGISVKEKLLSLAILLIMAMSCYVNTLDVIWHGFNAPVGFSHRQAFIICFFLIYIGFRGFYALNKSFSEIISGNIVTYISLALLAITIFDLVSDGAWSIEHYETKSQTEYVGWIDQLSPVISDIQAEDSGFYRIEKDFEWNHNDAMEFAYNGLTHNSSCENDKVKTFMEKMGFRYFRPIWAFYNQGSTSFVDAFLGVKYYISRYDSVIKPFIYLKEYPSERTSYSFINPYALPLAFGMTDAIDNVNMDTDDLFDIQNSIARCSEGSEDITIYNRLIPNEEVYNDSRTYNMVMNRTGNLYFYATAPDYQGCELIVNGELREDYFSVWRWNIICLGYYNEGESVDVILRSTEGASVNVDDIFFYSEDLAALDEWHKLASVDSAELIKKSSSHLTGKVNMTKSDYLVFTIPYEKAWKIKIDGNKVSPSQVKPAFGTLMSIKLDKGEHTIDMIYVPDGFAAGLIITILCMFTLFIFLRKRP